MLPEGVDEKILDDFHDPSPSDVEKYGQLANVVANKLEQQSVIEILDDPVSPIPTIYSSRSQKKLPTPTPTPTPALNSSFPQIATTYPHFNTPIPTYSTMSQAALTTPPPTYSLQPQSSISYPPPVGYTQSLFPGANPYNPVGVNLNVPPPQLTTPIIAPLQIQPTKSRNVWKEITSDINPSVSASKLSKEFFVEKQQVLLDSPEDQTPDRSKDHANFEAEYKKQEATEYKKQEDLRLSQQRSLGKVSEERMGINERLKCRWTTDFDMAPKTPVMDEAQGADIEVLDKAIANLDREIQLKRDGKSSNVELDRFGYVVRSTKERQPSSATNPADYYKSLFGADQSDSRGAQTRSPTRRRRSRSRGRRSRSRGRKSRSKSRGRKSRSRSRGRRSRSKSRRRKSKSKSRARSRSRSRRSRSPLRGRARYSISPLRPRGKSPVRRRPSKSRSHSRDRNNLRKSRSRSRSRGKLRMDTEPKKKSQVYSGPPVPAFMLHPADRLFSGDAERGSSVRKRMYQRKETGYDDIDNGMAALDITLDLIKEMKAEPGETLKEVSLIAMEVEILDDGGYKQFTQIGVSTEDKETGVFNKSLFRAILPTYMTQYDTNLILKNQNNLHSSLKFKFDENNKTYTFQHVKKGDDKLVSEEKALEDFIAFAKSIRGDTDVYVFTLSKGLFLPLLLARLKYYNLDKEFAAVIKGFCDFTSCITNLKLNGIWKETKFGDLIDVYKHIMGKAWPREPRHSDGISILSGSVLKKMIRDYTEYLNELNFNFSIKKFLKVCGLRTMSEMMSSFQGEIQETNSRTDMNRNDVKELELRPSDRPGEITIVTLKRFECIEVLDMDEVEEEGINEDDYFATEGNVAYVVSKTVVKPGFVVPISMKLHIPASRQTNKNFKKGEWCLVSKNTAFGAGMEDAEVNEDGECVENVKRVRDASKSEISRQIVKMTRTFKPIKDDMSKCEEINVIQVKVLNPLDFDMVLDIGDELALVKLEKNVEKDNPGRKTYTDIKLEAERRLAKEEEKCAFDQKRASDGNRKRKHKHKKRKQKIKKAEEKLRNSLDHDALDFEPIDSGEDIESSEDEMDYQDNSHCNKNGESKGDNSSNLLEESSIQATEECVEDKGDTGSGSSSKRKRSSSKERVQRKSTERESSKTGRHKGSPENKKETKTSGKDKEKEQTKTLKCMDAEFYTRKFYVQTSDNFTEIAPGKTNTIPMTVVPDFGYAAKDLVGRKCRISINTEFTELQNNHRHSDQHYKFNNYNLFEKVTKLELRREYKCSWYSPMVDVEIQNFTMKSNQYPKGVRLGVCRFIDESERNQKTNHENFYHHLFKCYPTSLCSVRGLTTATVTMILQEEQGYTIEDMVSQKCKIKKIAANQRQSHSNMDSEIVNSCCIKEQEGTVVRYTDPISKKEYPAVLVEVKNLTPQKKTYKRDLPLALCQFTQISHKKSDFGGNVDSMDPVLPDPVPIRLSDAAHYSQGPVSYGLPNPVSGKKSFPKKAETVISKPPSEEELKAWSVKKLKNCLGDAGLHQYGLKNDLAKRLFEFYQKNPSKAPVKPLTSKEIAEGILKEILNEVIGEEGVYDKISPLSLHDLPNPVAITKITAVQEANKIPVISRRNSGRCTEARISELDDGLGGKVNIMSKDGVYFKNGQEIPVLGGGSGISLQSTALSSGTASPFGSEGSLVIPVIGGSTKRTEKEKIVEVDKEKIMKKMGEIKSFESQGLEFFKSGMSILCREDFTVGPRERKIVIFKMPELDLFFSELAKRKILIKERDNDKKILTVFKQTANVIVNEMKSEVEVLVQNERNKECTVKASDKVKLIRVYVERLEKDLDHQFDIPDDDDIASGIDKFLESGLVDAVATTDIILQPKTYHSELCKVKLPKTYKEDPFALLVKHRSMNFGMRKMILVPKVLSFINIKNEEATVSVTMYNASKLTQKITKNSKIASVRVQKADILSFGEYDLDVDQRKKYGQIKDSELDASDTSHEGKPVLLSFIVNGAKKPSFVKMVSRSGKIFVPLGSELSGMCCSNVERRDPSHYNSNF